MDTSETYIEPEYILQCEKAEEIQTNLPCKTEGDIYYGGGSGKTIYVFKGAYWEKDIWLPRQGQLQKMLDKTLSDLVYDFTSAVDRYEGTTGGEIWGEFNKYYQQFTSMEQLWLAFVMKEKYDKVWNGEDWVLAKREVTAQ